MWELEYKESWTPKNWSFWIVVLEETLESSLDCKEIQSVHPKRDQSWVFIGRTAIEAETPILWPPDAESWLTWKDPDVRKVWRQEEKGTTEDEMIGWHHQNNGHGFGWTLWVGDGQGGLVCCASWDHRVSHYWETELNWTLAISCLTRSYLLCSAAKSLQSCLTLCDPRDGSPPGSSVHEILQGRVLEWGAIAFSLLCSSS